MKRKLIAVTLVLGIGTSLYALPPGSNEQIRKRLQPIGSVCRIGQDCGSVATTTSGGVMNGEGVYQQFCFACHTTGVGDAPKLGSLEDWQPRIDKGMDELMATTRNGLNAMPAKGTCMNCSDDELGEALDYMLDQVR